MCHPSTNKPCNDYIGMCENIEILDSTFHGIVSVGKNQAKLETKIKHFPAQTQCIYCLIF